jgi:hypothetical protein
LHENYPQKVQTGHILTSAGEKVNAHRYRRDMCGGELDISKII